MGDDGIMIKKLLKWSARKSHNVQAQAAFALIYGLYDIFGFGPTVAIIMKLRKLKQPRKQNGGLRKVN